MANEVVKKIVIVVRKEGGGTGGGNTTGKQGDKKTETKDKSTIWGSDIMKKVTGSSNVTRQKQVIKTNLTHLASSAKQLIDYRMEYWISGLGYETGDSAYQDYVQRQVEIGKDVTNVASNVIRGAVFGAWGGPIGIVVGTATAMATSVGSIWSKYATRERDYSMKVMKEESNISYMRARAGVNLTNGRLR